jgi:thioredoxin 1
LLASCSCNKAKKEAESVATAQTTTASIVKEILNQEELDKNVSAIVKFYSPECPACQMSMQPYEELAQKNPHITFYAVNIEKDGNFKEAHPLHAIPTFIAFKKGVKGDVVVGFNEEQIQQLINKFSTGELKSTIIEVTGSEDLAQKIAHNKLIVKFFSTGCGFCRMIAPVYEQLAKIHGKDIMFLAVDIDRLQDLARQYAPNGVPVFYAFKDGKQVDKVLGARVDELNRVVTELAKSGDKPAATTQAVEKPASNTSEQTPNSIPAED